MTSARDDFQLLMKALTQVWKTQGKDDNLLDSDDDQDKIEKKEDSRRTEQDGEGDKKIAKRKDGSTDTDHVQSLDNDPPSYIYTPLSNPQNCIRILELQPGQSRDLIVCEIEEVSLCAGHKEYDALSYVWGAPGGRMRDVQVGGRCFTVGANLFCALKYLRYEDRPRFVWVDAICIDQSNMIERKHQVPLMCEIYQNAACTLCFLGPPTVSTPDVYTMLNELAEERKTQDVLQRSKQQRDESDAILPIYHDNIPVEPTRTEVSQKYMGTSTIVSLVAHNWWHRAWTIQELVLSKNPVLMTGKYQIPWDDFCAGVDQGLSTQLWGHVAFGFLLSPMTMPYLSMRALMRRPSQTSSPANFLLYLLKYCRHRDSTDPRDKIYAVLGLFRASYPEEINENSSALSIMLGYNHDVAFVYRKISQEIILKSGSLDVLGVCTHSDLQGLPSWAPDWRINTKVGKSLVQDSFDHPRTTHASNHSKAYALFSDNEAVMTISGYRFSSITQLTTKLIDPILKTITGVDPGFIVPELTIPDGTGRIRRKWIVLKFIIVSVAGILSQLLDFFLADFRSLVVIFNTLLIWERFVSSNTPTNPGQYMDGIYWQTLCAGTYKNGSPEETRELYEIWSHLLQPVWKFMAKHPRFCSKHPFIWFVLYQKATWNSYGEFWPYITCSYQRRLGMAENGWLCLLPQDSEVGDLIILAKGGQVPLVIRPQESGRYLFVGEAYVHGIMDGEAWDESRCIDIDIC